MVQARGFDGALAALGVSAFAAGQLGGKLVGGWLLDRHEPRLVAALLITLPATGFLVFLIPGVPWPAVLAAAALIGVIQGAELDIFAYFIGRRFPLGQYGTIYGALIGLGWIGNAIGILGFSVGHDLAGGYGPIQLAAIGFLACAALLILKVRLPEKS
jgi:MFS family permease